MKTAAQKIHASTQKFTEIADIVDTIVLFQGGYATLIIEITASNFALLSKKEQDVKIYSYAALLNSLTFPIQIIIRNKRVDITSYLKSLEEAEKNTKNPLLAKHISLYRTFVHEMIRVNVVLSKTFYIAIPFSSLEAGLATATKSSRKNAASTEAIVASAKKTLQQKADSLTQQLQKLAVSAKVLQKEDLVRLFYDAYNDSGLTSTQTEEEIKAPIIKQAP